jgi:3D (Asp-Asp-Asp) domain-containing protein
MTSRITFLAVAVLLLASTSALAQQTKKFTIDCWNGIYADNTCVLCSTAGAYNANTYYPGPYPNEPWQPNCGYQDTLPAGTVVTGVKAELFMKDCTSTVNGSRPPLVFNTTLNGTAIASPITSTVGNCACDGVCTVATFNNTTPSGFPGYVAGGTNVFGIEVSQGVLALDHVDLTISYLTNDRATITSLEPYIPTGTAVVDRCVLYRAALTALVMDGTQPSPGRTVVLKSDRNAAAPVDTITQPASPTDSTGKTSGHLDTRKTGVAQVSAENIVTSSPASVTFGAATYQSSFQITSYYTPLESDFSGGSTTNPCGLTGTFKTKFLTTVKLEGSGIATNGTTVQYYNGCYHVDTCPRTSSGVCAQAGVTCAVDPTVVPMGSEVAITGVGNRTAQDIGGAIIGNHIDNYVGVGKANYSATTLTRAVRFLQGDPSCAN